MKFNKRFVFWVIIFSILGAVYAIIYVWMHSRQVKTLPQKIVYFPFRHDTVAIFFIDNLKYRKDYVDYVNYQLNNRIHEVIKFPYQNAVGEGDTIYIRKYLKDSVLVEFYCPKYHNQIWGLSTGYIHRSFIHDSAKKRFIK